MCYRSLVSLTPNGDSDDPIGMDIRTIQNGEATGPLAMLARMGLFIASVPYRIVVRHRNRKFDRAKSVIHRVDVPVVCIGNLTVGGTGKTPIVCHLAKWLRMEDVRVAIISRGYRSDGSGSNDEAKELAQRLPDVPHVQNADRYAAATTAVEELESQFLLMDDGFQHRRLHRDLDIVVIDATNPFGFGYLLPRGLLREPIDGLSRAGAVLMTRCDMVSEQDLKAIEETISQHTEENVPRLRTEHAAKELFQAGGETRSIDWLRGKNVITVCAIGNPGAFAETVQHCGSNILDRIELPDHDDFGPAAMAALKEQIESHREPIDAIVCTHKDLVKIQSDRIASIPLMAIRIELTFCGDPEPLYEKLRGLISQCY